VMMAKHAYSWNYKNIMMDKAGFFTEDPKHLANDDVEPEDEPPEHDLDDFDEGLADEYDAEEDPDMDDFDEGLADERRYESRYGE
jgi:hypothetical protein